MEKLGNETGLVLKEFVICEIYFLYCIMLITIASFTIYRTNYDKKERFIKGNNLLINTTITFLILTELNKEKISINPNVVLFKYSIRKQYFSFLILGYFNLSIQVGL